MGGSPWRASSPLMMISVCRSYPPRVSRPSTAAATSGSMLNLLPGAVFLEKLDDERLKPANPGRAKRWSAAFDTPHPFASNRSRASSYVSSSRGKGLMIFLRAGGEQDARGYQGSPREGPRKRTRSRRRRRGG